MYCGCVSEGLCRNFVDLNRIELSDLKQWCYLLTPSGFGISGFNATHHDKRQDVIMTE